MNGLNIFRNSEFGEIWVEIINEKEYFPAKECASILGYKDPKSAIRQHCRWVVKHPQPHPQNKNKTIEVNFIPEGDLYRLIVKSKLPSAERFESWIFDEVMPSIRKNGMYAKDELLDNPDLLLDVVSRLKKERDEKIRLQIDNEQKEKLIVEMQPKVDFTDKFLTANNSLLIREFAKVLKEDGFDTGEKRLYTWLRDNGILMKNNEPYQRYMDYFDVVERSYEAGNSVRITKTTRIKPNGQLYIFKRLKKEFNF